MESSPFEERMLHARAQQLAFLRQYAQTTDALERAWLLDQMMAALTPAEKTAGMARLQAWVVGLPPPELEATPEYAHYSALLPQVLAGTLDPASTAYAEFMAFIAQWDTCYEEYQQLRQALRGAENE